METNLIRPGCGKFLVRSVTAEGFKLEHTLFFEYEERASSPLGVFLYMLINESIQKLISNCSVLGWYAYEWHRSLHLKCPELRMYKKFEK